MAQTEWFRGVPWEPKALAAAHRDRQAEATTEVARGFIEARHHDPSYGPDQAPFRVTRGKVMAMISAELVVVGYGRPEVASSAASGAETGPEAVGELRPRGRGPSSYDELCEWLEDEGYMVVGRDTDRHPAVLGPTGIRLVTLNGSPSDYRSLINDTAVCRRVLGIALRRQK